MLRGLFSPRKCNRLNMMRKLDSVVMAIKDNLRAVRNVGVKSLYFKNKDELDKMLKNLSFLEITLNQYHVLGNEVIDIFEDVKTVIKKFYTLHNLKKSKVNEFELRRVEKEILEINPNEIISRFKDVLLGLNFETLVEKIFFFEYIFCWLDIDGNSEENFEIYKVLDKAFKEHKHCYIGRIVGGWISDVEKSVFKYLSRHDIKLMTFYEFSELEYSSCHRKIYFICFTDRSLDEIDLKESDRIEPIAYLTSKATIAIFFKYT